VAEGFISITFHLQAGIGASRVKYRLKKRLSKSKKTIRYFIISLRSDGKFAADITLTALVKKP
jgi:hypothetical protein